MKTSLIGWMACATMLYVSCGGEKVTIGGQDLNGAGRGGSDATAGSGGASSSATTTTGGASGSTSGGSAGTSGSGGSGTSGSGGATADGGVPCGPNLLCAANQHCCTNPVGPNHICTPVCTSDPCLGAPCFLGDASATPLANLSCWRTQTPFPPLDKSCTSKGDCFIGLHTINCCGSQTAVGLNVSAKAQFSLAETACGPGLCKCAQFATTAEDGQAENPGHPIQVDCLQGACSTFVP